MPHGKRLTNKTELVREVIERLELLYGHPRRIARFNPMDELVSCIMSQHTSDANSFPAFTRLKEIFPTWDQVVEAGPDLLADVIRKAGLANQKAKNIIACLNRVHERTGRFDIEDLRRMTTMEARRWLMQLPGVGPKTASIVLCFSMGRETIPVDTHVYRVSWRVGIIPEGIGENKSHDLLLDIVPGELAFRYHIDLIQHGRVVCRAPYPNCPECPLTDMCQWFKKGGPEFRKAGLPKRRESAFAKKGSAQK